MKLGLDIHGVLDANPEDFVTIAKEVRDNGGEVHVITGSSHDTDLDKYLLDLSGGEVFWDKLVSIQDELIDAIEPSGINEYGRPFWPDEIWDRVKGDYCTAHGIDLHFDDTERYLEYFSTPVILYRR